MELSHSSPDSDFDFNCTIGLALASENGADAGHEWQDDAGDGSLVPAGLPPFSGRRPRSRSQVTMGPDAVLALAGGIGTQIRSMARRLSEQLSDTDDQARERRGFTVEEVTLTFGITATAKAGQGLAVLVDVGGETNIEVTLTLKRSSPHPLDTAP